MNKNVIQIFSLCIVTLLLVCQKPVLSQPSQYTFGDLIDKANRLSQTIKIAEEDLKIAKEDKRRALSVLMPRANAIGSGIRYKDPGAQGPDRLTVGIVLNQSFTLNGKELIAYDVTKRSIESSEFSLESVRSDYMLDVSQAYYNILSAQRYVEIAQSDVERLTAHKDAVNEKLNVGNVTKTDLYRAQAELSKSKTELVRAENGVLQAKAVLINLVDIEDDFEMVKENIQGIETYDASLEEIQAFALKNRTEIKAAYKNLEIAQKTVKFTQSDFWPSVSLEAGYKNSDFEYETSGSTVSYDTDDLYISGELVFTLFDGGLRSAQVRQSLSDVKKAEHALELQKKGVILESKTSFLEYRAAKSALINLQDELKSAQENYNAVQMQFKYGMADSIDMMDANTLLVSAQRRISDATYIYYLSVLKILYAKGDLLNFLNIAAK